MLKTSFWFASLVLVVLTGCHSCPKVPCGECLLKDGLGAWAFFQEDGATDMAGQWQVANGVLSCRGTPNGYIYTKKSYRDFALRLEWRWPEGEKPGRGGVLVRMRGKHRIWPTSLEAQLNAGDAGDFWGLAGYNLSGPPDRTGEPIEHETFGKLTNVKKEKALEREPGQWNTYGVIAEGDRVTIMLNGKIVNQATGCDLQAGPICLTAEGNPIQFRNIQVTEIKCER